MKINRHDILNVEFIENQPISQITTYKTAGNVKGVFYPKTERELITAYQVLKEENIPFLVVGNGSNLLISPSAKIFAISIKKLEQIYSFDHEYVKFSASIPLSKAYSLCRQKSLSGFENLAGIPATIGGAIKNNASAFGKSIFDIVDKIKIYDGKIKEIDKNSVNWGTHHTNLNDILILSATFKLQNKSQCKITQDFLECQQQRILKQPKGFSCGSVFKNPPNPSAGKLIEDCGLKGTAQGGAIISSKHANFIINQNSTTFDDVKTLITLCQTSVQEKFNITLAPEVEIIE